MKISNIRLERGPATARAVADVLWEDSPRPPFALFFETDRAAGEDLSPEPEAFLTACVVHAALNGERRLRVEGEVCARLAEGAATAVALLRSWYRIPGEPLAIEASRGFRSLSPRRPERAAVFLTGGIDSTHLLRRNRAHHPSGHPASFVEAISVFGHLCSETDNAAWNDRALSAIAAISEEAGMALVPIRTNLWRLGPDVQFVGDKSLSSALVSATHLFRRRWSRVSIASARDVTREMPRGNHPLLDPLQQRRSRGSA